MKKWGTHFACALLVLFLGIAHAALPPNKACYCTPSDVCWPKKADWERLNQKVHGRLQKIHSFLTPCEKNSLSDECQNALKQASSAFFLESIPSGDQHTGWYKAWTSLPSTYAVVVQNSRDIAAAVNFARDNHLKLVIKGTGHDDLGRSNAPNSLLVWTHKMRDITLPIINKHFYALAFTGIRDNKNKPIIEYGKNVYQSAIVDTGTGGLTVLGENDHKKLIAYLFKTTSKKNQALGDKFWKDNYCVLKKNIDMASFPTLSIGFMDKQNKIHYLALAPHYYLNNGGCGLKYVRLSFTSYAKALPVLHKYQKLMPNFLTIPPIIFGTPLLEAYAFTVKRGEGASLHFTASGPLCQSSKP